MDVKENKHELIKTQTDKTISKFLLKDKQEKNRKRHWHIHKFKGVPMVGPAHETLQDSTPDYSLLHHHTNL